MNQNTPAFKLRTLSRGDTMTGYRIDFRMPDNVTPRDLTGCSILIQLRTSDESPKVEYQFYTGDNSIIVPNPTSGQAFMVKRKMNKAGVFVLDIQLTKENGDVASSLQGIWEIRNDVSRL